MVKVGLCVVLFLEGGSESNEPNQCNAPLLPPRSCGVFIGGLMGKPREFDIFVHIPFSFNILFAFGSHIMSMNQKGRVVNGC